MIMLSKIAKAIKGKTMVNVRDGLETIFDPEYIKSQIYPFLYFRVERPAFRPIVITSAMHVKDPELVQDGIAIGYLE